MKDAETYPECNQISETELFMEIVNDFLQLTNFAKNSILDARLGSEYSSGMLKMHSKVRQFLASECPSKKMNNAFISP